MAVEDGLSVRVDVDLDPAYNKLSKFIRDAEKLETQLRIDLRPPREGGISGLTRKGGGSAFETVWGFKKRDGDKALQALVEERQKAQNKLDSIRPAATIRAAQIGRSEEYAYKQLERAAVASAFGVDQATYSMTRLANQLPRIRYAIYDVSNTATIAGAAFLGMSVASFAVSAKMQRDFANVQRTTGASGDELQKLKQDFVELGQTIPVSWSQLTEIGTLAGQLGIASENIASFTETVAKFSATTDVSAQAAATALGRLDQLLAGDPNDAESYNRLASSILAVGVNSVATESQIIAIAQNIASIGNAAGLSRDEVIGFSGALASVGIQPELARGLTARLFGEIGTAISQGSVQLETFAATAGMSAEQFRQAWSDDAASALVEFLKGIEKEGANAQATLASVGITSVRDVPNILKLAQGYEEVARLLGVSADGFANNNEIQKQYAVITAQVAEKFNVLINSLQIFIAETGAGVNALGGFLDLLTGVVKALTSFASTPFGQAFFLISTSLAAIAGVAGLLVGLLARGVSAFLAYKTSMIEAAIASGALSRGANVANTSMLTLMKTMWGTVGASKALRSALAATGIGLLAVVASSVAFEIFDKISNSMKSAGDVAKETFGDLTELSVALKEDTAVAAESARANDGMAKSWDTVKNSVTGATYAIGENTKQVLGNMLANNEQVTKFITEIERLNAVSAQYGGPQLDTEKFIQLSVTDDEAALQLVKDFNNELVITSANADEAGRAIVNLSFGNDILSNITAKATEITKLSAGAIDEATSKEVAAAGVKNALGGATDDLTDSVVDYNQALQETRQSVEMAFSSTNVLSTFASDFATLIQGVYEGGVSFSYLNAVGQTNLANLQTSIASTIAASKVLGIDATEAVAALFLQLQASGVQTASLLSSLSGIAGVNAAAVGQYLSGTRQMGGQGNKLQDTMARLAASAKNAAKNIGGVGGAAGQAAKKVRTLVDYANDLSSVFKRAFDIRFSGQQALDAISKSFSDIARSTADAREEIDELNADLAELTADQALQEYFLRVAEAFGDTVQAAKIRANLAKINTDITAKTRKLTDAQAKNNKTLVGNSDAAIENRGTVTELIGKYQEYIRSLAASGMSQGDLSATAQRLKGEFIAQARQLGFNEQELGTYAAALDDVTTIINNVPRDVTIGFNVNPALQALAEFNAKLDETVRNAGSGAGAIGSALDEIFGMEEQERPWWYTPLGEGEEVPDQRATMLRRKKPGSVTKKPAKGPSKADVAKTLDTIAMGALSPVSLLSLIGGKGAQGGFLSALLPKQEEVKKKANNLGGGAGKGFSQGIGTAIDPTVIPRSLNNQLGPSVNTSKQVGQSSGSGFTGSLQRTTDARVFGSSIAGQLGPSIGSAGNVGGASGSSFTSGVSRSSDAGGMNSAIYNNVGNARNAGAYAGAQAALWFNANFNAVLGSLGGALSAVWRFVGGRDGNPLTPWASGGYTGAGGKYEVAGIVHKGEYVVPKEQVDQSAKLPYFMTQPRMFADGGYVGRAANNGMQMVALSPEDRALLRSVGGSGEVVLYANNEAIARSANAGNRNIVAQGGRP